MKETSIRYRNLNDAQKTAIDTLLKWTKELYTIHGITEYYTTEHWLYELQKSPHTKVTHHDLGLLKELWDVYVEFKSQN